jgi:Tol biopolymer transport system component
MQVLTTPRVRPDRGAVSILEILEIETGKRRILREFPDTVEAPNWTKDGKFLIYNSNGRLYRYELSSGEISEIYTGAITECNNDHVLNSDNSLIGISHATVEDGLSRIYTVPFTGGEPALVTPIAPSYLHGWSPDGNTLVYCGERNGQYDIYAIPFWGGREKQLSNVAALNDGPEYSPDGKYIWFCSTRTGLMQLWRMRADGSNPEQMTFDDSNSWFPHISPDGKMAVYIAYNKNDVKPTEHPPNKNVELRLMPASGEPAPGAKFSVIAGLFGGQGTINVNSWSPDSKSIAFVSYRLK